MLETSYGVWATCGYSGVFGCGLGGASRYLACPGHHVTGIDLTDEYVAVAKSLSHRVGMEGATIYRWASALELPFEAESFDGAYMLHVGMNIADKPKLFVEVQRVLKRDGPFGVYDVMREGGGDLRFPLPWASDPATSFAAPEQRRVLTHQAA